MRIDDLVWPVARAGEALAAVADSAGLGRRDVAIDSPRDDATLPMWLAETGSWLGLAVEPVSVPYGDLDRTLRGIAPALIAVRTDAGPGIIAVTRARRGSLIVIDPGLGRASVRTVAVRAAMCREHVEPLAAELDATIAHAKLTGAAATRAREAMLAARLASREIAGVFLVQREADAAPRQVARDHRLGRRVALVTAVHLLAQALWIGSWWMIGHAVLDGRASAGWLAGWALLLASSQLMRILVSWMAGRIAIDLGVLLAQRLMLGAIRVDADVLRRDGVGVALGQILESQTLHSLAIHGGIDAVLACIEIMIAGVVLAVGAGGVVQVGILVGALVATASAARAYLRHRQSWTARRLELTHGHIEAMAGHATRLVQGDLDALEDRDDRDLVRYLGLSREMDRARRRLSLIPAAWPIVATLGLVPALLVGTSAGALATGLGGIVLAQLAIGRLASGGARVVEAIVAWRSVRELYGEAERDAVAAPALSLARPSPTASALDLRHVELRYASRGGPVLSGCELVVERGDRVLLEGASGAGKSTLGAVIAGLRRPQSGLVLAGGLDRISVGARGWRRRVAFAPQFHDNHVFAGPLAFNLLFGRAWPPSNADLAEADAICRDLGLGPLIDRMPAGFYQQVGETGWQLSHGERSRVFLARTLLQGAPLVVLDESLAALDPENLTIAVRCIEARAAAAIVISHG